MAAARQKEINESSTDVTTITFLVRLIGFIGTSRQLENFKRDFGLSSCGTSFGTVHSTAVTDESRPAKSGSEQYNSGMALTALAKKPFRTLASRVIPQCGMVSHAVAFNMFLAFFAVLLTALSVIESSLEGKSGQEVEIADCSGANAFIEGFNGKFRDGCLNQSWQTSLEDVRQSLEAWREDHVVSTQQPWGYLTPGEYVATAATRLASRSHAGRLCCTSVGANGSARTPKC